MTSRQVSPVEMQRSAALLHYLVRRHASDCRWLAKRPGAKLIYALDATELKAFVSPDRPNQARMRGFVLAVDPVPSLHLDDAQVPGALQLLNELVLRRLLFEGADQVVVLPPHLREFEAEIRYVEEASLDEKVDLLSAARRELAQLTEMQLKLVRAHHESWQRDGKEERMRALVSLLVRIAPSLVTLLHGAAPGSPRARLDELLDQGRLVTLREFAWEELLPRERHLADELRGVTVEPARTEAWLRYLHDHPERADNSHSANRVDAESLAWVEMLNGSLSMRGLDDRLQFRLVTRATTLINAGRDEASCRRFGLTPARFLRHPRLLVDDGRVSNGQPSHEALAELAFSASEDETGGLALALEAFRNHTSSGDSGPEAELRDAWARFERGRVAVDLWRDEARVGKAEELLKQSADRRLEHIPDAMRGLLELLRDQSSSKLEGWVRDHTREGIRMLASASFRAVGQGQPVRARVQQLDQVRRTRLVPLHAGVPGPVEFSGRGFRELEPEIADLAERLSQPLDQEVEVYLAWALIEASRREWSAAETYARTVEKVANLLQGAGRAVGEAQLLRAQVLRLKPVEAPSPTALRKQRRERFHEAQNLLDSAGQQIGGDDPRILSERVAQMLELAAGDHVLAVELHADPARAAKLARRAADAAAEDLLLRLRALDLMLLANLVWEGADWKGFGRPLDGDRVRATYEELAGTIDELQRTGWVEMAHSPGAEAIKLIFASRLQTASSGLNRWAPSGISEQATQLYEEIEENKDACARLLLEHLKDLREPSFEVRLLDLIYAPLWPPDSYEDVLAAIDDEEAREAARKALAALACTLAGEEPQPEELLRVARAFDAVLELMLPGPSAATFRLRMQAAYARLLHARLLSETDQTRSAALEEAASLYKRIAEDFPKAAIPHYRLSTICYDQGDRREAFNHISRARELFGDDPFVPPEGQWVRYTINRRLALFLAQEAEELARRVEDEPENVEMRRSYHNRLLAVLDVMHRDFKAGDYRRDPFAALEARRTINNIVYLASLYLDSDGPQEDLDQRGLSREALTDYLDRLGAPGRIEVAERGILHTIGFACLQLGRPKLAAEAGNRLFELIVRSEDDPRKSPQVRTLLVDAVRMARVGG